MSTNNKVTGVTATMAGSAAVPNETLLHLGGVFAAQQIVAMMGEPAEAQRARGLQEGIVLTLRAIMDPAQFRHVVIQWEIDPTLLDDIDDHLAADDSQEIDV